MDEGTSTQDRPKWLELPLIATIARLLCKELTLQNEYLKTENRILRSKFPGRIPLDDDDRRALVDSAVAMGRDLMKAVVNIGKPDTILAWQRRLNKEKWDYSDKRKHNPGRPRISVDVESLVCRLARENIWGYEKIQGELKKLEINLTDTTVANILYRNGLPSAPDRKGPSWREFLAGHADVLLCADFLTQEVWTVTGLKTAYIFFVIHLQTRKVLLSRATFSPNAEWLKQQARNVLWECVDQNIQPRFFLCDRDPSFSEDFCALLKSADIDTIRTAAPRAERERRGRKARTKPTCRMSQSPNPLWSQSSPARSGHLSRLFQQPPTASRTRQLHSGEVQR